MPHSAEVERDALARIERLVDATTERQRARILAGASDAVLARVAALEAKLATGRDALPTLIPGSGEIGDAALPPAKVGAFRLTERIGRGGMGEVWAGVRDDGLYDQTVAIKLIQRHALARAAAAFDDERRFLARLEHPNIARLIDGGVTEDGLPWLAIEYVDGLPIDEAAECVPLGGRMSLFLKAADAVQYAHSRMIAHADLKPSNILVGHDGRLKLLDFGISQLIDGESRPVSPSSSAGAVTRAFASPQRLAGDAPSVADDIFALGRTLTLMLDGEVDAELAAIAAKAQHADEAKRYGSVAALIADVERWRARLPVAALPATMRYRANKFIARHRMGVGATGAALVLLSATSLLATTSYLRAETTRVRAEQRFDEVRDLSRFMLFDLYDELARQPGTVAKRAEIAASSARYLERLNLSDDAGRDLRLDAARSYRRLAEIQGVPALSNLGQPDLAQQSLARARTLLTQILAEQPRNADALTEMGWVDLDRWTLLSDTPASGKLLTETRGIFERAQTIAPNDWLARLGLLAIGIGEGYQLVWTDDRPADAVPVVSRVLARLRATKWPPEFKARAADLEFGMINQIGDAVYYAGDWPGALPHYREAEALINRRIAREGATPTLVLAKSAAAFNVSGTLNDINGHNDEALAVAREGITGLERLLAAGPDSSAEKRLLVLYGQEAVVLENMGRIAEALVPLNAGIDLREARLAALPNATQRLRDLAIGMIQQARVLDLAGQRKAACVVATRNMALWRRLKDSGNLGGHDATKEVSKTEALQKQFCVPPVT
ncbi:MAG: serine/threonine-protein kinase [Sphingomonas sp.]